MTARSTVLPFFGLLNTINTVSDPYASANWVNRADEVILQVPFGIVNNVITLTDDTAYFFEVLQIAKKAIWIRMDLVSNYTSAEQAQTAVLSRMQTYYSWFQQYNLEPYLKGFYFENFGFDFSYSMSTNVPLTRLIQNRLITEAHVKFYKPVMVNSKFPSDAIIEVGPARGIEDRQPLMPSILGKNPVFKDWLYIEDPIVTSWSGDVPTFAHSRVVDALQLAKSLQSRNLGIACVQRIDLTASPVDSATGLTLTSGPLQVITDYAIFMRAIGLSTIGVAATDYGKITSKAIDPDYVNNNNLLDNYSGYSTVYTKSSSYYVNNPQLPLDNIQVPALNVFNASFHFTSGIVPPTNSAFVGPQGETGPTGPQGNPGPVGPPGINDSVIEHIDSITDPLVLAITGDSGTLVANCNLNSVQFIIPQATSVVGKKYTFKKVDSTGNNLLVTVDGGGYIDAQTTLTLNTQWARVTIQASPKGVWLIISN